MKFCDPKSVINGLIIGDNPETTGMVSHSDIEQTDTGDMLASECSEKEEKKDEQAQIQEEASS